MQVEIVVETGSETPAVFSPDEDHSDLRANLESVARIAEARHNLPLQNFLVAVNGSESIFATADISLQSDLPTAVSGAAGEFASQMNIMFAIPSLNSGRAYYAELSSGLKELLERDASDAVRAILRISPCVFTEQKTRGFCLGFRLVAAGSSTQQAELRWGLGLARVQQALLFMSRAMKQQVGE